MTREEAIQVLNTYDVYFDKYTAEEIVDAIDMAIEALTYKNLKKPNNTCEVDLISREDAIEAIQNAYCKPCKERGDDYNEVRCRACEYDNAIIQIDALPSADITDTEECQKCQETTERVLLNKASAEADRPTGEWKGYNADNPDWLRKDGTPIFLVCDKCHDMVLNNSSTNWNYCPNCGAIMKGGDDE